MGPIIHRRTVLIGIAAAATNARSFAALRPDDFRIGTLPELPPTGRGSPGPAVLRTDGLLIPVDGWCIAMQTGRWVTAGLARRVPRGYRINSDAEKLWMLGRSAFAPRLTNEILERHLAQIVHRNKVAKMVRTAPMPGGVSVANVEVREVVAEAPGA